MSKFNINYSLIRPQLSKNPPVSVLEGDPITLEKGIQRGENSDLQALKSDVILMLLNMPGKY